MAPFRHRLRVRYAECDPQGIVFNANYVMYFDTVLTELWREAYGSYSRMVESGTDLVVAEVRVRFLGPARFDEELDFQISIAKLGNTALATELTAARAEDGAAVVEGELRHVCVDPETLQKKEIPHDLRAALEPYSNSA